MPGYGELLGRAYGSLAQAARSCGDCGWELAKRTWAENAHLGWPEVLLCGLCALGWTALRRLCCRRLFGVSAGGDHRECGRIWERGEERAQHALPAGLGMGRCFGGSLSLGSPPGFTSMSVEHPEGPGEPPAASWGSVPGGSPGMREGCGSIWGRGE